MCYWPRTRKLTDIYKILIRNSWEKEECPWPAMHCVLCQEASRGRPVAKEYNSGWLSQVFHCMCNSFFFLFGGLCDSFNMCSDIIFVHLLLKWTHSVNTTKWNWPILTWIAVSITKLGFSASVLSSMCVHTCVCVLVHVINTVLSLTCKSFD